MAKIWIIDPADKTRVPFLRGILTRSLTEAGLSFDEAYRTSSEIRQLLDDAGVSYGIPGINESCCGDHADRIGAADVFSDLVRKNSDRFIRVGVKKLLTTSPHCLEAFKKNMTGCVRSSLPNIIRSCLTDWSKRDA